MIDAIELATRARKLGVDPSHIEKDYILNCVLAAIAESGAGLVFRGGTALARVYWPDFRLSEDLDFVTTSPGIATRLESLLSKAVDAATSRSALNLRLDFGSSKRGWSRSFVRSPEAEILIDVNVGDRAYLPVASLELDLPYSDLRDLSRKIPVVQLAEILGNKWFMLDDRNEPRDLYDVWAGLKRFNVSFEELALGHRAKYGFTPMGAQLEAARQLKSMWTTRLAHQLADLPAFEDAYAAVLQSYEEWHDSSHGEAER
jgi:uncharacterized protein